MAQGLKSNSGIFSITQDAQGFIWIATHEGVSRFNGSEFRNYGSEQGFDTPAQVHTVFVRQNGEVWALFGAYRYDPHPFAVKRFQAIPVGDGRGGFMIEDHQQTLWCGTPTGLYRKRVTDNSFEHISTGGQEALAALVEDERGVLWLAIDGGGLLRRLPSGGFERYDSRRGFGSDILCFLKTRDGRVWAGASDGFFRFRIDAGSDGSIVDHRFGAADGMPSCGVYSLTQTRDGHIWAGTRCGLVEMSQSGIKRYTVAEGLSQNVIECIFEDRDGDLWLGTESAGVMRFTRNGIATFGAESGLDDHIVDGLLLDRRDRVAVVSNVDGHLIIRAGNESGFRPIIPALPLQPTDLDVEHWQVALQDHDGFWWIPGKSEIRVFSPNQNRNRLLSSGVRIYDERSGLPRGRINAMLEDKNGDIWIGLYRPGCSTLVQWIRSLDRFRDWRGTPGVPLDQRPIAFAETRSGSIWISYRNGDLGRFRNGKHILLKSPSGRGTAIFAIHEDDAGRLWTGRRNSAFYRIENPDSDCPSLRQIPGIATPFLRAIVSDRKSRLYLASESGLTEYDPSTGSIRQYHERDGLPSETILNGVCDRSGVLWFGTGHGVVRFEPRDAASLSPPAVWINSLEIAGSPYPGLSDRGERTISDLEIQEASSRVRIGFSGISLRSALKFQYRLEPYDRNWSLALADQYVVYPRLAPSTYRFQVRAVGGDGTKGQAAELLFKVVPPFWRRAWFLSFAVLAVIAVLTWLYRLRVDHILQLDRMRMRIASDLHDDLGANLTQIAVVSEDLHRAGGPNESLALIAESARDMTSALGDVVWSINPAAGSLEDLFSRMRRLGNDLCDAHRIEFRLEQPDGNCCTMLDGHLRRNLFLIFKEALRNSVRHSRCQSIQVVCHRTDALVGFTLKDDGVGFDLNQAREGQGLSSMRRRAAELNASFRVSSSAGGGTSVSIHITQKTAKLRRMVKSLHT